MTSMGPSWRLCVWRLGWLRSGEEPQSWCMKTTWKVTEDMSVCVNACCTWPTGYWDNWVGRMPVTQLDIWLCNWVPWCITYRGTATQLCNRTIWQLPGCTTGRSDSYLVVQPDGLKATQLYSRIVWQLLGYITRQAESSQLHKQMIWSYPMVWHDSLKGQIASHSKTSVLARGLLCGKNLIWLPNRMSGCTTGWWLGNRAENILMFTISGCEMTSTLKAARRPMWRQDPLSVSGHTLFLLVSSIWRGMQPAWTL